MNGMGVGYKHLDQLRDLAQNEEDKSSRIRPLLDGMGALNTSIWTGYIIWPKGDMRLCTRRSKRHRMRHRSMPTPTTGRTRCA